MTIAVVAIYKGEWSAVRQQITDMQNKDKKDRGFAKILEEAKAREEVRDLRRVVGNDLSGQ